MARLEAAGSESARLDAELLLAHALGADRTAVLAHPEAQVGPGQLERFESALSRREKGEPVAYIRGLKEFYGLAFSVDARGLIPRPETETLVELAEQRIVARLTGAPRPPGSAPLRVLDVGTGSGAIPVALAVALRRRRYGDEVRFVATDSSAEAVALALENAVGHGVADVITFAVGDLVPEEVLTRGPVDLVLANLPYIPTDEVPRLPVAASFEPAVALDGGADGLEAIRALLARLPATLADDGLALLEIGSGQVAALGASVDALLPGWRMRVHPDLGGAPRVAELAPPERGAAWPGRETRGDAA